MFPAIETALMLLQDHPEGMQLILHGLPSIQFDFEVSEVNHVQKYNSF